MSGGNLPGLKALMARMNGANRSVLVGVPSGEHTKSMEKITFESGKTKRVTVTADKGDVSLATIAAVHEFGSPEHNIPERSFLRGGIRRAAPKLNAVNIDSLRKVLLAKMSIEQAIEKLGMVAAGEVKREFIVGDFVPNKPATIKRKGSSRPLVDTGQLRQSITFIVEGASNAR
jgi:phage gpG-like protein